MWDLFSPNPFIVCFGTKFSTPGVVLFIFGAETDKIGAEKDKFRAETDEFILFFK